MKDESEPIGRLIGRNLKPIVAASKMTQGQLVYKTRLSSGSVSNVVNGNTPDPSISTIIKFARALGVSVDSIVGLAPQPELKPTIDADVLERLDAMQRDLTEIRDLYGSSDSVQQTKGRLPKIRVLKDDR